MGNNGGLGYNDGVTEGSEAEASPSVRLSLPSLPVIENISHSEQAAEIDEREASEFTSLQHADFVARTLGWTSGGDVDRCESVEDVANCELLENGDQIILGKLNRMPKALREELSKGASLRACRSALEVAGFSWKVLSGAFVFVHPWQYRAVVASLSFNELRPYNVIFSESLGYLIEETLSRYKGSWMTACAPVHGRKVSDSQIGAISDVDSVVSDCAQFSDNGDDGCEHEWQWVVCVQRTFLCVVPKHFSLETNVTSSTTGVHCSGLANPRLVSSERDFLWQS